MVIDEKAMALLPPPPPYALEPAEYHTTLPPDDDGRSGLFVGRGQSLTTRTPASLGTVNEGHQTHQTVLYSQGARNGEICTPMSPTSCGSCLRQQYQPQGHFVGGFVPQQRQQQQQHYMQRRRGSSSPTSIRSNHTTPAAPPRPKSKITLAVLPPHILLVILSHMIPQKAKPDESKLERKRKALYWMATSLRLTCRVFYQACMHVLRSTYLPAYTAMVRPPYSSDPYPTLPATPTEASFPSTSSASSSSSPFPELVSPSSASSYRYEQPPSAGPSNFPITPISRETQVLDLFISLKVREDVWLDDSELHLERDESFRDLFDLMQPRARAEDLVGMMGTSLGIINLEGAPFGTWGSQTGLGGDHDHDFGSLTPPGLSRSNTNSERMNFIQPYTLHLPRPTSPPSGYAASSSSSSSGASSATEVPPTRRQSSRSIPFSSLSLSFSPRRVGLVLTVSGSGAVMPATSIARGTGIKRTIAEASRGRDEPLEVVAKKLVGELRKWLAR